jgi:hypothetical protein
MVLAETLNRAGCSRTFAARLQTGDGREATHMQLQLMLPAKERVHSENALPGGSRSTITSDVSSLMPSCTFMMDVMTFWGADCMQEAHGRTSDVHVECTGSCLTANIVRQWYIGGAQHEPGLPSVSPV